ncbi:MAG: hypothetical protein DWB99_02975 [Candidatus Poseidoniales archaeon]|nr:MAG: hypothetical protein DWB99_02975 [Candidatus Poseidoniales archaeon]
MLMLMRRLSSLTLVAIFLLSSLSSFYAPPAEAASARGGSKDDFSIYSIVVGNQSVSPEQWVQPDGSVVGYVLQGSQLEVEIKVYRDGQPTSPAKQTNAKLEIVHPIGFVMETFYWVTGDMAGQAQDVKTIQWTATEAHSILNTTTNELTGGIILRASVNFSQDNRNDNDIMSKTVPVAINKDIFDGTASGSIETFRPGRYPVGGGDATAIGSWSEDTSGGAVGSSHWRMSTSGNTYPSSAFDRLVQSYINPNNNCGNDQLDSGMTNANGAWICRSLFYSSNYISSQIHVQAWGTMGAGDSAYLEFWRNNGNFSDSMSSIHWDLANGNPSPAPNQWKNFSWDPQVEWSQIPTLANPDLFLGGNSWTFGLVFKSDSSGATQGMHIDDFVHFGISKVEDYTLTADCNDPSTGFEGYPSGLLSWHCMVTNNGYKNVQFRAETSVSNSTWMDPMNPQLRLDTDNPNDNDFNVVIPPIGPGETTEVWANLSIPPGADVQQQDWEIWFTDASSQNSGEKARNSTSLSINSQYSVSLTSQTSLNALTLNPGESGIIPFKFVNTGNLDATFVLSTTFSSDGWTGIIYDDSGAVVTSKYLTKGEQIMLNLNVTAAPQATPELVSTLIRATRTSGEVLGTTTLSRNIEVPILKDFSLVPSLDSFTTDNGRTFIEGYANGNQKMVLITLTNAGNSPESYEISVINSIYKLGAYVEESQKLTPLMAEWGETYGFFLILPMSVGIEPGYYDVKVIATNVADPSVKETYTIQVDILETAAVFVETRESEESYIPGDFARTMTFEVRNDGNLDDSFTMSMDVPEGMVATFTNLVDQDKTPVIPSGASYNVSVEFSFIPGTSGNRDLDVIATSQFDSSVSASGGSSYLVGSQNEWVKILPSQQVTIDTWEDEVELVVEVRNQYSTAQSISMEISEGESNNWLQSRISASDKNFVLGIEEVREVVITFEVTETTLMNLQNETFMTEITLWARSDTVSDAAQSTIQIQLRKTIVESDDSAESSFDVTGALTWAGFIVVMIVGIVILVRILKNTGEEEDDYAGWGDDGYQDSISATYGAVKAAPTIPTSAPTAVSVPSVAPPATPAPAPVQPQAPAGPPLPDSGLPQGWSMDQWNAYGHQWLEQYGNQ